MAEVSIRFAVAALQLTAIQLLEAAGLADIPPSELSINLDGYAMRIDIARLDADGHIAQWLAGWSIDPNHLDDFGRPIALPGGEGSTH